MKQDAWVEGAGHRGANVSKGGVQAFGKVEPAELVEHHEVVVVPTPPDRTRQIS